MVQQPVVHRGKAAGIVTARRLATILATTRYLLLDFDGPICAVFAGHKNNVAAARVRDALANHGPLPAPVRDTHDPFDVLRHAVGLGPAAVTAADLALQAQELAAIDSAAPTPGGGETIAAAAATDRIVAIVTNNTPQAVRRYLRDHDLLDQVAVIAGRAPGRADLLKPHPHLLTVALSRLGARADQAVLVGDQPSDIDAAHSVHVRAIGYANKPGKRDRLAAAGADTIITSMTDLAHALRSFAPGVPSRLVIRQ